MALATVYGEQGVPCLAVPRLTVSASRAGRYPVAVENEIPLVLVVDDSITVRRVTQRLLKREGYRVTLASDGLDALERSAGRKPTVVSDIEMPRMDG